MLKGMFSRPVTRMAPTTAIAEIAFVSDIRGLLWRGFVQGGTRALVLHFSTVRDDGALLDVVGEIEDELLVFGEGGDEGRQVA